MKSSSKKNKVASSFRLSPRVSQGVRELIEKKPLLFSQTRIAEAAFSHFLSLSEEEQVEMLEKYLTKQTEESKK